MGSNPLRRESKSEKLIKLKKRNKGSLLGNNKTKQQFLHNLKLKDFVNNNSYFQKCVNKDKGTKKLFKMIFFIGNLFVARSFNNYFHW